MGLFSGLEKFGMKRDKISKVDLYEDEKAQKGEVESVKTVVDEPEGPKESDYLLLRTARCPICDKNFKTKAVKNNRARRIGADNDLRPRTENIDTLKYGVTSCPVCGYSAMNDYFEHISTGQIRLIREEFCSQIKLGSDVIKPSESTEPYSYNEAIERYQLALFATMVKKGKASEKAYTCLRTAWLFRGKREELEQKNPADKQGIEECRNQEREFYEQAYEGFTKALSTENSPICGMNETTMDFLLAAMGLNLGKYDEALRFISHVMGSNMANSKTKERAKEIKDQILEARKKEEG